MRSDEKLAKVTPIARYLFVILALYCAEELTDGRVPKVMLPQLYPAADAKPKHLAELVTAGLVDKLAMADDYYLPAFLTWNPSKAQRQAELQANRLRQAMFRERQAEKRTAKGQYGNLSRGRSGSNALRNG